MAIMVGFTASMDSDAELKVLEGPGRDLFGFESTRWTWHEDRFKELSLKYLTLLKDSNIYLKSDRFDELRNELTEVLQIMKSDEYDFWKFRFGNAFAVMDHIIAEKSESFLFIG